MGAWSAVHRRFCRSAARPLVLFTLVVVALYVAATCGRAAPEKRAATYAVNQELRTANGYPISGLGGTLIVAANGNVRTLTCAGNAPIQSRAVRRGDVLSVTTTGWVCGFHLPRQFEVLGRPFDPTADTIATYRLIGIPHASRMAITSALFSAPSLGSNPLSAGLAVLNGSLERHARFQLVTDPDGIISATIILQYCNQQLAKTFFSLTNKIGFDTALLQGDDMLEFLVGALPIMNASPCTK